MTQKLKLQFQKIATRRKINFFVAVSVIDGDSKAEVNIKSGDEIKVGGENSDKNSAFTANANVENKISNTAVAASKDKSTINTAVGVTSYTSDAAVNVDRAITAENGSVKIDATNNAVNKNYTSNSFNGEIEPLANTVILDKNDADKKKADKAKKVETESNKTAEKSLNAVKSKLKKLTDKNITVPEKAGGSTFSKVLDGEYLKTGVSVGVFNQTNSAVVNIKNNAKVTAKNDVAINSATEITRQNLTVDSEITNTKNTQNSAAMIGVGVLVSNITNNADIVVEGKLNAAEGSIETVADGGMKYDQFNTLLEELKAPLDKIKTDVEKLGTENKIDKDTKEKINKKIDEYLKQIEETKGEKEKTEKKDAAAGTESNDDAETSDGAIDFTDKISSLDKALEKITKDTQSDDFKKISEKIKDTQLKSNVDGIAKKLNKLNHPSNYANSYVNSAFHDSDDANTSDT